MFNIKNIFAVTCCVCWIFLHCASAIRMPYKAPHVTFPTLGRCREFDSKSFELSIVGAVLPGDPLVTGTLSMGIMNGIKIYSNVILAR